MKIVFCRWKSICEQGITNAISRLGYTLVPFDRMFESVDYDKNYLNALVELLQNNPDTDCVLSVNFQPIIARTCKVLRIPYISWTVDCPQFQLYSKTIDYPTNRIFLFDRMQYERFAPYNPDHIFYMPLGCDLETWDSIKLTVQDHKNYDCDVSFVGSLYSEKTRYNDIEKDLPEYMRGYVDGLINAQLNVYGYNFIEDSISEKWAQEFKKYADWIPLAEDYREDTRDIVADTYLGYKCTEQERIRVLTSVSEHFNTHLWTLSDALMIPKIHNRGGADSNNMMPHIIKCSKINLNMTNKPIKTGLPLRIFDLMGAGGFVISNYQAEIPEYFEVDKEIVLYESIPDLINKIDYYLKHDDERKQIAQNGHDRIKKEHTYDIRIPAMLKIAGVL